MKDQGLLKILVSRASKYLQSLKVSELKVEKLTEQLTAVQKVSSANKEQLEKAKKQVQIRLRLNSVLTLNATIATKVVCFSHLLKC